MGLTVNICLIPAHNFIVANQVETRQYPYGRHLFIAIAKANSSNSRGIPVGDFERFESGKKIEKDVKLRISFVHLW